MFEISSGVLYSGVIEKQPGTGIHHQGWVINDEEKEQATIIAMGVIVGLWWFAMIMICVATGNI